MQSSPILPHLPRAPPPHPHPALTPDPTPPHLARPAEPEDEPEGPPKAVEGSTEEIIAEAAQAVPSEPAAAADEEARDEL